MPRKAKELAAYQIKRLAQKPGFHAVGGVAGLYLHVSDTPAASWILRATVGEKRRDIGCGGYPDTTLEQARTLAREMRLQIRAGIDPVAAKREVRDALKAEQAKRLAFSEAALACWKTKSKEFRNAKHAAQWLSTITKYANPVIGSLPVSDVELAHIVRVLEPIWETKTETASRLRGRIESVLAWAKVSGYRTGDNPARWKGNLDHVLPKPSKVHKVRHHRALPWHEIPAFMADLRKREGVGARALEFLILTAARSGEVLLAPWDEIDLDAKIWNVPGERMKSGKPHRVPLSGPAIKILKALPRFEGSSYVFPAARGGSLSDISMSSVCRRMKVAAVPHGMRSSFSDWCAEATNYPREVAELALAHAIENKVEAAYRRGDLLPKRTRLMRDWAKFCGAVPGKADVTPIRRRG